MEGGFLDPINASQIFVKLIESKVKELAKLFEKTNEKNDGLKITIEIFRLKIKMVKLYNDDCLNVMSQLGDNSVDLILCDLPYGCTSCAWDIIIPFGKLWEQYKRLIKPNGNIVLFSSGLFTYKLMESNLKDFKYKLIWKKTVPTGMSSATHRPMTYSDEPRVFTFNHRPPCDPTPND